MLQEVLWVFNMKDGIIWRRLEQNMQNMRPVIESKIMSDAPTVFDAFHLFLRRTSN